MSQREPNSEQIGPNWAQLSEAQLSNLNKWTVKWLEEKKDSNKNFTPMSSSNLNYYYVYKRSKHFASILDPKTKEKDKREQERKREKTKKMRETERKRKKKREKRKKKREKEINREKKSKGEKRAK